jgi:tRNA uridine 5-carboxymethylaminomethyl modification enzyme
MMQNRYDVIVVGAGHAGCEAAAAAAQLGSKVLLMTMNMQTIGQMSCNPAMGGIAKGQIVREIDALGGMSGIITDKTMIQFRMLNRSKGPAMWSPRAQSDRWRFAEEWRLALEAIPGVDFYQDMVTGLVVEHGAITGVKTSLGLVFSAGAVVLTSGTFLNGVIHIGERQMGGGRAGERAATGITEDLIQLGFDHGRMKTGTPPRVDGRSLDYSKFEEQAGDEQPEQFSYLDIPRLTVQRPCHIAYTSQAVHEKLREGFDRSPMFNGRIQGLGPRYCPSIEDKIDRFADKDRHQIFVEPEGWDTVEVYVNGFSTSLPQEVQYEALKLVPGFENVRFFRPGYAIEYDYFPPTQLKHSLETKLVEGLFFAGQINGTTGYEEAAGQGLMAGINAHLKVAGLDPFVLDRSQAYIGVLIDDLITKGTEEPYRMFTSRAEFRILLRQDNADVRLTPLGRSLGLVSDDRWQRFQDKQAQVALFDGFAESFLAAPEAVNADLERWGTSAIKLKTKLKSLLARPQIQLKDVLTWPEVAQFVAQHQLRHDALEQVEIDAKYSGYIEREREAALKLKRLEALEIPKQFDYGKIPSLSYEARQKLTAHQPATLGQAGRISGVSPADLSVLLVYMGR